MTWKYVIIGVQKKTRPTGRQTGTIYHLYTKLSHSKPIKIIQKVILSLLICICHNNISHTMQTQNNFYFILAIPLRYLIRKHIFPTQ